MLRISRIILFACLIIMTPAHILSAGWSQSDTLVSIDGDTYTPEDYENWWANWREEGMKVDETPDPFIDWTLLYREAEKMRLFDNPEYQRKIMVFLKFRSLMMLKHDEVDSKINITEDKRWTRYKKEYSPLWKVNFIFFKDKDNAAAASAKIADGTITVEELHNLKPEEGGAFSVSSKSLRPGNTHPEWQEIILNLKKNSFSEAIPWQDGYVILHLLDVIDEDRHDFEKLGETIRRELWKEEERKYTAQLLDKLMKKYKVDVDRARIKEIDSNAPDDQFSNKPLVKTSFGDVSEKDFIAMLRKYGKFRQDSGFKDDEKFDIKERSLNDMISQTLTTHEALERHYEKEEPFKNTFTFYSRHRMVKMFEEKVIQPEVIVSDDDIQQYYKEHPEEFTTSETVKLVIIKGDEDELQKVWSAVITGADFMVFASQQAQHGSPVVEMKVDQMDTVVRETVQRLSKGEVSQVVPIKGQFALLKLLEKYPAQIISLDHARINLKVKLQEKKFNETRAAFVKRIRNASEIHVDKKTWQKLRKELVENDDRQN